MVSHTKIYLQVYQRTCTCTMVEMQLIFLIMAFTVCFKQFSSHITFHGHYSETCQNVLLYHYIWKQNGISQYSKIVKTNIREWDITFGFQNVHWNLQLKTVQQMCTILVVWNKIVNNITFCAKRYLHLRQESWNSERHYAWKSAKIMK